MGRLLPVIVVLLLTYPVRAQQPTEPQHQIEQPRELKHASPIQARTNLTPADIFARARSAVVVIFATDQSGQKEVLGSGFVVKKDRIATNHHVLEGMNKAFVVFSDGDIKNVSGVVADSPQQDLIVLAVETANRSPLTLGDELSLQQGDTVYAIGAPRGLELSLTNGIVSSFRNSDGQFLLQTTAAIAHGSSGGPLFDSAGRVVGITTSLISDSPGIYFSVGVGDLKRLVRTPQLVLLPMDDWAKQNQGRHSSAETKGNDPKQIEALLDKKKFDEARAAIQLLSEENPDTPIVHRLKGELSVRTGDINTALHELSISVKQEPSDTLAHFYYAVALFEVRRFQEALSEEESSYRLAPTPGDKPLLALLYYANRDYAKAEPLAREIIKTDPDGETALSVLTGIEYHGASTYVRYKDSQGELWDIQRVDLESARKRDPKLQVVSQTEILAQRVQHIAEKHPDNFWVHLNKGQEALKQNQTTTALSEFSAAEKDDFPDATAYLSLVQLYMQASQIGQASDQIRTGLDALPGDPQLLNEGMFVSLVARDNTEAKRRFDEIERLYPNSGYALWSGCLYYYATLQSTSALSYCNRLATQFPNNHVAHSNYGWAAIDANQIQVASQEFSKSYDLVSSTFNQLTENQVVDLLWGTTLTEYLSGDKKGTQKLLQVIREKYPTAATVTGLQQMPLLWSPTTMSRIETVLREFPK